MAREVTKPDVLRVRITEKDGEMIDALAADMGTNRSEATRRLIWEAHKALKSGAQRPKTRPKPPKAVLEPPATPVSRETPPDALSAAAERLKRATAGRSATPVTKEQSTR